jgi:formamidopyrimidine-DNA glycosylase
MTLVATGALEAHPLFRDLGVEPLGDDFDGPRLAELLAGARTPLKSALLDQRRIAGLSNIYVCEALYRAWLSPLRRGRIAVARQAARPRLGVREVLEAAIVAGGSTLRDHRQTDGALGYFQRSFEAYDRVGAACRHPRCAGTIARVVQNGRSTFWCAGRQR